MFIASLAKAALSAAVVGALLMMLRRASPRASGLAAAVPINSAPALFWLSFDQGGAFAANAALGALWGTGLTVLLGIAFARLALRFHVAWAGALACVAVATTVLLTGAQPAALTVVTALALTTILVGQVAQPQPEYAPRRRDSRARDAVLSMGTAGGMSLLVSELSRYGGPQFCGLVATIPVICFAALQAAHRQGGVSLMVQVLDGYLSGMLAKAAFLGVLVFAWSAGAGQWGWAMAFAGAAVALLAQRSLRRLGNLQLGRLT